MKRETTLEVKFETVLTKQILGRKRLEDLGGR